MTNPNASRPRSVRPSRRWVADPTHPAAVAQRPAAGAAGAELGELLTFLRHIWTSTTSAVHAAVVSLLSFLGVAPPPPPPPTRALPLDASQRSIANIQRRSRTMLDAEDIARAATALGTPRSQRTPRRRSETRVHFGGHLLNLSAAPSVGNSPSLRSGSVSSPRSEPGEAAADLGAGSPRFSLDSRDDEVEVGRGGSGGAGASDLTSASVVSEERALGTGRAGDDGVTFPLPPLSQWAMSTEDGAARAADGTAGETSCDNGGAAACAHVAPTLSSPAGSAASSPPRPAIASDRGSPVLEVGSPSSLVTDGSVDSASAPQDRFATAAGIERNEANSATPAPASPAEPTSNEPVSILRTSSRSRWRRRRSRRGQ